MFIPSQNSIFLTVNIKVFLVSDKVVYVYNIMKPFATLCFTPFANHQVNDSLVDALFYFYEFIFCSIYKDIEHDIAKV